MTRQIIPVDRVVKCHVNSVDGSTNYEASTAYEAGTLVTFNDMPYVAIIDIEDSDTDTPIEAPAKWGLTPNALGANAESYDLDSRVDALETFVAAIPDGYAFIGQDSLSVTDENGTYSSGLDLLASSALEFAQSLDDDELIIPFSVYIEGSYSIISIQLGVKTNAATAFNIVGNVIADGAPTVNLIKMAAYSGATASVIYRLRYTVADGTWSYTDLSNSSTGDSKVYTLYYLKFKKIKNS